MSEKPAIQNDQSIFMVLAVQLGFVKADKLMSTASAWMTDPSVPLSKRLEEEGLLSKEKCALLEKLVQESITAHSGDASEVMNTLGAEKAVKDTFSGSLVLEPGGRIRRLGAGCCSIRDFDRKAPICWRESL